MPVDLKRTDLYEVEIPDDALETCLKVLRTFQRAAFTASNYGTAFGFEVTRLRIEETILKTQTLETKCGAATRTE